MLRELALKATIEESDHPAVISRMGALSPRMINCFNPDADPYFTQWVLGALASRNFKFLVVRDDSDPGRILAGAPSKVRRTLTQDSRSDTPNLFLERGLSEIPYLFRAEMLDLLAAKAQSITAETGIPVDVSHQVFGRIRSSDIRVGGTGAYTDDEYAEAVFHLRNSRSLIHMARSYDPEKFRQDRDERVVEGFGIGRKGFDSVVSGIRKMGANIVVDIRPDTGSRKYRRCPRGDLESRLGQSGIHYVYMGDTLGNPAGGDGATALASYREFMRGAEFAEQARQLVSKIHDADGHIVILGNEAKQRKCTRNLLIGHVLRQLTESGDN